MMRTNEKTPPNIWLAAVTALPKTPPRLKMLRMFSMISAAEAVDGAGVPRYFAARYCTSARLHRRRDNDSRQDNENNAIELQKQPREAENKNGLNHRSGGNRNIEIAPLHVRHRSIRVLAERRGQFPCIPMRQEPTVRCNHGFRWLACCSFRHSSLGTRPQHPMVGKMHPTEKVNAGSKRRDTHFVGMQIEV